MPGTVNSSLLADLEARGLIQDTTDREVLAARLAERPITLYCGFDPTADSLHVGNLIGVLMLRRFAEAGHDAIGLAGGATGMIGDPSGKSEERNLLDDETLARNLASLREQLGRIAGVELVDNGDWTKPVSFLEFLRDVGKHVTVNQMVAKESVKARMEGDQGISYTEFSYMLIQANDFLHLHRSRGCDLQIGGSDQWGNITMGADLIRKVTGDHGYALTWPLLLRSDGRKFGKSEAGNVWLGAHRTSPYQFFQYWMQVPDADVERFLLQLTMLPVDEAMAMAATHAQSPEKREGQRRLAREITTIVHGADAARDAEAASAILFGGDPREATAESLAFVADEVPTTTVERSRLAEGIDLIDLLVEAGIFKSKGEARRTLNGVAVNSEKVEEGRTVTSADLLHDRWVLLRKGKTYHLVEADSSSNSSTR
ncbi:MAG: tyrosyl-tRNA synthetase [Acidimicrobiales bacterium]|nr:tyrosyl-tRNA synthetase [Acidimicrobiales bacterium]